MIGLTDVVHCVVVVGNTRQGLLKLLVHACVFKKPWSRAVQRQTHLTLKALPRRQVRAVAAVQAPVTVDLEVDRAVQLNVFGDHEESCIGNYQLTINLSGLISQRKSLRLGLM